MREVERRTTDKNGERKEPGTIKEEGDDWGR